MLAEPAQAGIQAIGRELDHEHADHQTAALGLGIDRGRQQEAAPGQAFAFGDGIDILLAGEGLLPVGHVLQLQPGTGGLVGGLGEQAATGVDDRDALGIERPPHRLQALEHLRCGGRQPALDQGLEHRFVDPEHRRGAHRAATQDFLGQLRRMALRLGLEQVVELGLVGALIDAGRQPAEQQGQAKGEHPVDRGMQQQSRQEVWPGPLHGRLPLALAAWRKACSACS